MTKFPQCESCVNKHMMKCDSCYLCSPFPTNYQAYSCCDSTSVQGDTKHSAPREWFIDKVSGRIDNDLIPSAMKLNMIHVIEYSAVEALKAELEKAKGEIKEAYKYIKISNETAESHGAASSLGLINWLKRNEGK